MVAATRTLSTAEDRRETVLEAAEHVFAEHGFSGTPTTAVAKAAGISHAYLFRLFPTKSDLAIAVTNRCHERILRAFTAAAAHARADGEDVLAAMGTAYQELLADKEILQLQLHSHAAAIGDPTLREAAAAGYGRIVELVKSESGADDATVAGFMATGMLLNVVAALGAMDSDAHWAGILRALAEDKDC